MVEECQYIFGDCCYPVADSCLDVILKTNFSSDRNDRINVGAIEIDAMWIFQICQQYVLRIPAGLTSSRIISYLEP